MRRFGQDIEEILNGPIVEPRFLIKLEFDEPLYLSTRGDYKHEGINYESGLVHELKVTSDEATFGLVNSGYAHTLPAIKGEYHRAKVKVWWVRSEMESIPIVEGGYFEEGYYDWKDWAGPYLVFSGRVDNFSQISSVLGVVATRSADRRFPAMRVTSPLANYLRPKGAVIQAGDSTFRLDPRRGKQ